MIAEPSNISSRLKLSTSLIIVHRRNGVQTLTSLPPGAWIEIDIDLVDGEPVLAHDPPKAGDKPDRLADFLPHALRRGVAGFVFDCKREGAVDAIDPYIIQHGIENYFYINETETEADMALAERVAHKSALRVWQYRGARDVIRYAEDMKKAGQGYPVWIWLDGWQRGLREDIGKALVPLTQTEAHSLRKLGVHLCLCSPELYAHDYDKKYTQIELEAIYHGVVNYRKKLLNLGIVPDAVCTKFPWLWTMDIDLLLKAKSLAGS